MIRLAGALALVANLVLPAAAEAARPHFIAADLIAETAQPKPGGSALVGLRMVPKPGWHSYWSNPGEAGFPTVLEWKAPKGVHFGPLRHPAPSLIQVAGMASYVHEGPHVLVTRMTLERGIPAGTAIPVTAEVSWAACSEKLCVPEKATLSMQLTAGNGQKSAEAPLIQDALAREPRPLAGGGFDVDGEKLLLELPAAARPKPYKAQFFPDENGILDVSKARVVSISPTRISMPVVAGAPSSLTGVVTDGQSAYRLQLKPKRLMAEGAEETKLASEAETLQPIDPVSAADRPAPEVATAVKIPTQPADRKRVVSVIAAAAALAIFALTLLRRRSSQRMRRSG